MDLMDQLSPAAASVPTLSLSMATAREAVRDVQRRRYKVFVEQGQSGISRQFHSNAPASRGEARSSGYPLYL